MTVTVEFNDRLTKMKFSDGRRFIAVPQAGCTGCHFRKDGGGCNFFLENAKDPDGCEAAPRCSVSRRKMQEVKDYSIVWVMDPSAEEEREQQAGIDMHYDMIDRHLRATLDDAKYRVFSAALDEIYHANQSR